MRLPVRALLLLAELVSTAACDVFAPNGILTSSDGLRTFAYQQSVGGAPVLCTLEGAVDPVVGTLAGNPDDRERVWLETSDGRRLSVV
jgi:hypothetical protein